MTPAERIKILLLVKKKSIAGLARSYATRLPERERNLESLRKQLSMCINGTRELPQFQEFIAEELEQSVEQLFGQSDAQQAA